MILSLSHIKKTFVDKTIIEDATFMINEGSKVAIVGNNGCGKSTLLKIITGELSADSGDVSFAKDTKVGYLAQYQTDDLDSTILDSVINARADLVEMEKKLSDLEANMASVASEDMDSYMAEYHRIQDKFTLEGGYTFRSEAVGVLKGLGFNEDDFTKAVKQLSGGLKTRVSLGRLLVADNDLLLLDEPINHLDLSSIMWLENYLASYKKAVIIVAHDRYFLDRVVDHVVDIFDKKATIYKGNYSAFVEQKDQWLLTYQRSFEKQQKEIEHQKEVIEKLQSFNREKSIKRAESRKKLLEKMDVMEGLNSDNKKMALVLETEKESGKDVLFFEHVTKSYGDRRIFTDISFEVYKGDKVAILGDNGTGKTTILKVINGLTDFEAGNIKIGSNVDIGYYDQEQQQLDDSKSVFDEIHDEYPYLTDTRVRNTLAAFLFTGEDVFKSIGSLSGGERGRVSLAKLMLKKSNLLILDEPTNHLDMDSKEILEDAINDFDGTLLYVSHDRYFVNKTATVILELTADGLKRYTGNYDDYLAEKEKFNNPVVAESIAVTTDKTETVTEAKLDYQEQKRLASEQRKLEAKIKKVEDEIAKLEDEIKKIDEQFMDPANASNSAKLNELSAKQQELKDKLEEAYNTWEELSEG